MLRILLIWILLGFVLGVAFGKFAKEGMGPQDGENPENQKESGRQARKKDDADPQA